MRGPDMTTKEGRAGLTARLARRADKSPPKAPQPHGLAALVDWDAIPRNRKESK